MDYPQGFGNKDFALKEAFNLHHRTYSAKIERVKEIMVSYVLNQQLPNFYLHFLNATFYNFSTFRKFEQHFFQHKFKTAKKGKIPKFHSWFKTYVQNTKFKDCQSLFERCFINKLFNVLKETYYKNFKITCNFNPTIQLDSDCYKLITKPKQGKTKTKNYLEVVSLESGKRIKGIELTGYKGSLPRSKHYASNIMLSFNPVSMDFYLHFAFRDKTLKTSFFKNREDNKKSKSVGMDLGQTETGTLSDGKIIGFGQGKILKKISQKETILLSKIQTFSKEGYFGKEKINKGKRNNTHNCFNHNKDKGNINLDFKLFQQKSLKQIKQFLHQSKNELIHHCITNHIDTIVVEKLSYSNLGRKRDDRKVFNLIKGFYGLLENELKKFNIKLSYVNSAYTKSFSNVSHLLSS